MRSEERRDLEWAARRIRVGFLSGKHRSLFALLSIAAAGYGVAVSSVLFVIVALALACLPHLDLHMRNKVARILWFHGLSIEQVAASSQWGHGLWL